MYPMKLRPVLKDIIWGGVRLAGEYKKGAPGQRIAESWELCVHPNGVNIIENGDFAGKTLEQLFNADKSIVSPYYGAEKFPVLIKFIDAAQDLSVQVHPDDAYAAKHAGELGKTEMWYIIDAEPGARLAYGLNADYTRGELEHYIKAGEFERCLNYVGVKPGDIFFIPAGLVHAIGAGILLAEVQQNSDTTYRLYDYNRPGADGSPRELHVNQGLDVCIKSKSEYNNMQGGSILANLAECEYFSVTRHVIGKMAGDFLSTNLTMHLAGHFVSIICVDGKGKIICGGERYNISKGDSYFIPGGVDNIKISGRLDLICTGSGSDRHKYI